MDRFMTFIKNGTTDFSEMDELFLECPKLLDNDLIAMAVKENTPSSMIQYLINKGCNVNITIESGWSPLIRAIQWGRADLVEILLAAGADPSQKTYRGDPPIVFFLGKHHHKTETRIIKSLLIRDPNLVNSTNRIGTTALHRAVMSGNIESTKLLLSYGVDTSLVNIKGESALDMCRCVHIARLIILKGFRFHNQTIFNNTMMKDVLEAVWSLNDDVFGELMGFF